MHWPSRMSVRHGLVIALGLAALVPTIAAADSSDPARGAAAAPGTRTASATTTATTVTMELVEPGYDGLQRLLDSEARQAMADGQFRRAWYLFWRLLEIDPDDTRALREAGRVAQALGKFEYSVAAFARVELLRGDPIDPELHYLRGEALDALGRRAEAEVEWTRAEQQIGLEPLDRQRTMWLARIAALRHRLDDALALYQTLVPADRSSPAYAEIALAEVEAYTLSKKWPGAERALRRFLTLQPDHPRALALLAWVLEAQGTHGEVVRLRADFAGEWVDHPTKTVEYARALERVYRLPDALARYREARALGVDDLDPDIERVAGRVAPELAAGVGTRTDGSGTVAGWNAGANLPFGGRNRLVVSAVQEASTGGGILGDDTMTSGALWALRTDRDGDRYGAGVTGREQQDSRGIGASAMLATSQDRAIQIQLRGDYGQAWRESATTVREGGVVDNLQGAAYARALNGKLLLSVGVQGRRLALAARDGMTEVHAAQVLGVAGVDYVLSTDPTRVARGEILGDELLMPRSLSSSIVLSYRHYELSGDDPFGQRLTLVTRSSLDELSASVGQVLDPRGMIAVEARGGYGHDWLRDGDRYRVGGSLMLSLTRTSRLTLDYDLANETFTGLVGRRQAGMAVLHVDL